MNLPSTAADPRIPVKERRVAPDSALIKVLRDEYGIQEPTLMFVYGAADGGTGPQLNVLYVSENDLRIADLQGPVVLANTQVQAKPGEVIKAEYVNGATQYCTVIAGQPVWF